MGTDNLFHKRRAISARGLARRAARRAPYDRVLIVCEGQKTEPNYFLELRDHYGINSANIEITGECGTSPANIYRYAKQKYREAKDSGNPYDRVYCIFDRDSWPCYEQVMHSIRAHLPKDMFYSATSTPSFEFWLLLHFEYTTRPYSALPGNSPGNQVLNDLKNYMPDYTKQCIGVFEKLLGQIEQAKVFSKRAMIESARVGGGSSTTVHELVAYLQELKSSSQSG